MSIYDLQRSKELVKHGKVLGREGISKRVCDLVKEFTEKHPDGHYFDGIQLAGRLHALYLATDPHDYWREVAERGFNSEFYELRDIVKRHSLTDGESDKQETGR